MALTYEPIATTTLGSNSTSVVFSNIPQTYTDLIMVFSGFNTSATAMDLEYEINGDSGNNYNETGVQGSGGGGTGNSFRHSNYSGGLIGSIWSTGRATVIAHFMNYTNTSTYKTCLGRFSTASGGLVGITASVWRNTSAITSLNFNQPSGQSGQYASGSKFTLYGIKAA